MNGSVVRLLFRFPLSACTCLCIFVYICSSIVLVKSVASVWNSIQVHPSAERMKRERFVSESGFSVLVSFFLEDFGGVSATAMLGVLWACFGIHDIRLLLFAIP